MVRAVARGAAGMAAVDEFQLVVKVTILVDQILVCIRSSCDINYSVVASNCARSRICTAVRAQDHVTGLLIIIRINIVGLIRDGVDCDSLFT